MRRLLAVAGLALAASQPAAASADFSAVGATPADIAATVGAFRAALGANNGVTPGSQAGGRREITWDGGGASAPAALFSNPMTAFSGRGTVFTTPGSGFEISGQPTPEFGDINPAYPDIFQPFSGTRIFAPLGSTVTDVTFNVPGSVGSPAVTRGFGVVFLDVDRLGSSGLQFFDRNGRLFASARPFALDNGLSFLGAVFDDPIIARVRIISGDTPLGANDGPGSDVVAMDDFIFGEPMAVPEPANWALMILGFGFAGAAIRCRRHMQSA